VIDHGLGVGLLGLIGHFLYRAAADRALLLQAAAALVVTLAAICTVGRAADAAGQAVSEARNHGGIPAACRRPLASRVAQKKWRDQAWQLAIHVSMTAWEVRLLGLAAARGQPWWEDPYTMYTPCPQLYLRDGVVGFPFLYELRSFYVLQLVLWMWTGVSAKWLEERRKDYVEMMLHHVMTVALILGSFLHAEYATGLVILAVHDASDIVLDAMKMANYLKVEGSHGGYVTESLFVLNTYVVWPFLRLYRFPVYVIPAVYYAYPRDCNKDGKTPGSSGNIWMLYSLFLLHCFWWVLLNRIAWKMLNGKDASKAGDEEYEYTMQDERGLRAGRKVA
jgi:ceramide synthetase